MVLQVRKLYAASRPYIFVFIARPESINEPNGVSRAFVSPLLRDAIGPGLHEFTNQLHQYATQHARQRVPNQDTIIAINKEVEDARRAAKVAEEKLAEVERERVQLAARVATLEARGPV
ncbi:hypothetical protein PHLCEN_2v9104 [Hermanssonia centrifuga]|uniref:Uncharacterized protein n=1 Tax=Hermanssonia centrifuga TaxID=98765 RepID=A0A2R6NRQ1_9APHY|nr:hypothetical protein PHLCEN_2v9104 [Hermanssonia centrifuga]